jgi:hypothetical protein
MKAAATIVLSGMALLAGSAWAGAPGPGGDAKSPWLTDFAAAQELARRDNRPILAVLHCGH